MDIETLTLEMLRQSLQRKMKTKYELITMARHKLGIVCEVITTKRETGDLANHGMGYIKSFNDVYAVMEVLAKYSDTRNYRKEML